MTEPPDPERDAQQPPPYWQQQYPPAQPSPGQPSSGQPGQPGALPPEPNFPPEPASPPSEPARGSISRQEPGVTRPRPPTVAEARARDKARRQAAEAEQQRVVAAERKRKRNRRLMGGAAVVGVVALVAVGYKALSGPERVSAQCIIDENGEQKIVDDDYCSRGTPGSNGIFILGGHQYRYYYGGSGTVGQRPSGGSTVQPKGTTAVTKSGSSITRGGLGSSSSGGKSSGGSGGS